MRTRASLLLLALLLLGTTACGKDAASSKEATTQEQTEVTTQEVTTEEETTEVATTEEVTEEAIEATAVETTIEETTTEAVQETGAITLEEAQELIEKAFGAVDEATGNTYSFGHVDTMTVDGEEYHVFMWSWLVDDHMSRLSELFVKTDGSAIYQGEFIGDNVTVYTDTNYLE